jgi:predicted transcriptional regulator
VKYEDRIIVRVSAELAKQLEEEAKRRGVSRSAIHREALEKGMRVVAAPARVGT